VASQVVVALGLLLIAVIMAAIAAPIIASIVSSASKVSPPQVAAAKLILLVRGAYQFGVSGHIVRVVASVVLPTDYPSPLLVCVIVPVFSGQAPMLLTVASDSGGWCRAIPSSQGSYRVDFSVFVGLSGSYTYSDPSVWLVGVVDASTRSLIHSISPIFEVP
jgi:hypothetical protein